MFTGRLILFYGLVLSQTVVGLSPGDACTIEKTAGQGKCKHLSKCPTVVTNIRKQKPPTACGFEGDQEIVCCPEPIQKITRTKRNTNENSLSQQKCKEYSEIIDKCEHEPDQKILNGIPFNANPKEFPQTALVGFESDHHAIRWDCVGTLISDEYLLTAAHCMTRENVPKYIRLGDLDINSESDDAKPETFNITEIIPHPDYRSKLVYNDIGLLRMDRKVKFNQYIRPTCLPTTVDSSGTDAVVSGWGTTEFGGEPSTHLLKFPVSKLDHKECLNAYKDLATRKMPNGIQEETQLCGKSKIEGHDLCLGSSGAPLQIDHSSLPCMRTMIGLSSIGVSCGSDIPTVYTRVFPYVSWIETVIWNRKL